MDVQVYDRLACRLVNSDTLVLMVNRNKNLVPTWSLLSHIAVPLYPFTLHLIQETIALLPFSSGLGPIVRQKFFNPASESLFLIKGISDSGDGRDPLPRKKSCYLCFFNCSDDHEVIFGKE